MGKRKFNSPVAEAPVLEHLDIEKIYSSVEKKEMDAICVIGPTASGKTRFAVELSRILNSLFRKPVCEIISADSRQFYRGMDIGSGKDLEEYGEIPFHLINILPAGYKYNIYEYQKDFSKACDNIAARGCFPIICGGSGLYVKSAIEGYYSGTPLSVFYIGLFLAPERRICNIETRLDGRLQNGMIGEIETLLSSGVSPESLIYYGLEYKYVTEYVLGQLSFEEMRNKLFVEIRRFAKRQMTWFRHMEKSGSVIHWVSPDDWRKK